MDDVQEMRVEGMILPSRSSQYNLENELPVEGKKKKKGGARIRTDIMKFSIVWLSLLSCLLDDARSRKTSQILGAWSKRWASKLGGDSALAR